MTAIEIRGPGGPEVLERTVRPVPRPRDGEVLIRVHAAGVSRPDVLQRRGLYPPPPGASDLPGLEVAGVVVASGAGVCSPAPGDRVIALLAGGGYAEYAVAPALQVLPLPRALSYVEGAALPENVFTVWTNVFERARLAPGETLLVHGASGGIGTTAVQLAKALGSRVIAVAGSEKRCAACVDLGAHAAIDRSRDDFVVRTLELTGGRGADVILEMVCGDQLSRDVDALAVDGRIAIIAFLKGATASFDVRTLMKKRATITGSTLRSRTPEEKGVIAAGIRGRALQLLARRAIAPPIDAVFPLAEAARAHARLDSGEHFGKIVLVVG